MKAVVLGAAVETSGTTSPLTWLAYHAMAFLASMLIIVGLSAAAFVMSRADPHASIHDFFFAPATADIFRKVAPAIAISLLAAFWLWIAMLRHFLANRATASSMWLFWLVVSSWGAAIVYFLLVWRPGNRPAGASERMSLLVAIVYLALAGLFAWLFYTRYWKWRECIDDAMSSCTTPDGDVLIGGGRFWLIFAVGFAVASVRRAIR